MRAKWKNCFREQIFLMFVSIVTLIVMVMATKMEVNENQKEHPNPNQMEDSPFEEEKAFGNETDANLSLDFDSGDLAYEQEETTHKLKWINGYSNQYVECRAENIKSISALYCHSLETCEEIKSCFFDQNKCSSSSSVQNGRKCSNYESGIGLPYYVDYNTDESSTCFRVGIYHYLGYSGIVQCTSEENGVNVTTFDHYTLRYSKGTLLSTIKNVTVDMIKMKIYVSGISQMLNGSAILENGDKKENSNVTLFEDEEVTLLECQVPKLLFHKDGLIISVHRKDGSTMKLGPKMTSVEYSEDFVKAKLTDFRVPADMVGFSCSAQRTNSSGQWLENWINVTVQELPSELIIKSSECRNMTVDLTSGAKVNLHCELTGPLHQKLIVKSTMRKMAEHSNRMTEPKSTSIFEFVRFYQVAREHLNCKELDEASENATWKTEHQIYYGAELPFHFIFNLAPSAPKIYKSFNQNNSSSSVHMIYQEEHVAEQTLFCMFSGEPEPVITWMKNGQELFFMKSLGFRRTRDDKFYLTPGNETLEHVKLPLHPKTIQPTDFYLNKIASGKAGHVNFSCVARNKFGSDRLDFIITMTGDCKNSVDSVTSPIRTTTNFIMEHSTNSSSTPTTTISTSTEQSRKEENSNSTSRLKLSDDAKTSKTLAIVGLVFLLSFISLAGFWVLWRKRNARAQAHTVQSRRILSFQNLVERERNEPESTRNASIQ